MGQEIEVMNIATYAHADRHPRSRKGPLAGVRVADFCWMGVGSIATRLLADYGAEVIKIEDRIKLDMPRRLPIYKGGSRAFGEEEADPNPDLGGMHNNYSRNKLGVTINMRTEKGRELARKLIAKSSVVTENFAPGIMEKWGLTYDALNEICPEVIYARMSGFGHSGPDMEYRSFGPVVQAVSGISHISGLPGEEPSGWGLSYMDNQAAYYNSAALLMAILTRNRTGKGTEIDVSAVEVGISLLGSVMLEVSANSRSTRLEDYPLGNRLDHPLGAPHGVYPCQGEDRWVAIAVFSDEEWENLIGAMGHPSWSQDESFSTHQLRSQNQDALDQHISEWTKQHTPHEAMTILQRARVRAGAVQNAQDLNEHDPQLAHRGIFFEMDHPVIGMARFEGSPMHFSGLEQDNWRSAPLLGEDNHYVFKEITGLSDDEFDQLVDEKVI